MRETIRQALKYVLTGGMTTVINYVIFFGLMGWEMNYLAANTLAWAGAVIFAFVANRNLVFQSTGNLIREMYAFVSLRLLTVLIENMLLFMMVDFAAIAAMPAKILVSVITVILNYYICKHHVFSEGGMVHE